MANPKAFFAYSSQIPAVLEDIRSAVKLINDSKQISITTWEDFSIGGQPIINKILKAIRECDLFICDLTDLNSNVLYEFGYAIAHNKKIWITLNSTHPQAENNYKAFRSIKTIGYVSYNNSQDLTNKFFSELPHEHDNPFSLNAGGITKSLIYLKCDTATSAANAVSQTLLKTRIPLKTDDPYEGETPLTWYLEELPSALGVVIHFHTSSSEKEKPLVTARKSLVAGLSHGLSLKTLLLGHAPYEPPLDYHDQFMIHMDVKQCENILNEWLAPIIEIYNDQAVDYREYRSEQRALGKLSNLIIGDFVAENENQDLLDYFLETSEYREALTAQQVLFVGRKGTGKTANLIKLQNELSSDKRNFILTIQPQGHEFEGVLSVLAKILNNSEKGHLIESIWKYLIYTEIAKQYYEHLLDQPLHYEKTEEESQFFQYVVDNLRYIDADFTLRLENIVQNLGELDQMDSIEEQRFKVSEFLHEKMISKLRDHLGNVLYKREKVTLLIDNLDRSWNDNANLEKLSDLLFGLLNVVQKITEEFQRKSYKHLKVNLSLIVFLRSDIFSRIMNYAPERDKIPYKHLSWSESRMLFRVIENRIEYSITGVTSPDVLWEEYFCDKVRDLPLKEYVEKLILPRPRDIVFFFKEALQVAVNNGHSKVEEEDFIEAEYAYSHYALKSLLPENGGRVKDFENILYEFAGEKSILSRDEIEHYLADYGQDVEELITILCEMTFIGQEIRDGVFEYYSEKRSPLITDKLANKLAQRKNQPKRYQINPAFHAYLEIEKS
ncbi:nucleotide-binding protein [Alkalihalobacillus oceani]|uniref:Nucleotide-binding protein n=1 Tax=Halalkalibacter oceani TaxID=1653776 RepID=A0A9X2DRT6_9BACI|nr:nucleotide-binding protein [Halalkalibacter oceani]MCM3715869.1 nucleotide-binding protein [Halalkalibacter oceani]